VRDKVIEEISITHLNDPITRIRVDMQTSAGTYVKEFISGDEGRTVPCLWGLLGCSGARCVVLDVVEVCLEWPPRIGEVVQMAGEDEGEEIWVA
jgi:tRNA pseudouridine synthase 10